MLTQQGEDLVKKYYLRDDEDIDDAYYRFANAWCGGDFGLRDRLFGYLQKKWFVPSSPTFSNAPRGEWINGKWHGEDSIAMPASCFLITIPDTIDGQIEKLKEIAHLSVAGGGIGIHNKIRAVSEKAPGPIPYEKVIDSYIGYFRQGKTRRGSVAYYMDIDHPSIVEHVKFRIPGGDHARKSDNRKNFHSAVNISEKYLKALFAGERYDLKCPHSGKVTESMKAWDMWRDILESRSLRGEPYMCFIDVCNRDMNPAQKALGRCINGSNLCTEIVQPTDDKHTAACILLSLVAYSFDEWKKDPNFIKDVIYAMDNIIEYIIERGGEGLENAIRSMIRDRSLGLGLLGFHSYLQKNNVPFESGGFNSAVQINHKLYSHIKAKAVEASQQLAQERGEPSDLVRTGMRHAYLLAPAPNANSAMFAGNVSPSNEPRVSNVYTHETRAGSHVIRNHDLELLLESKKLNTDSIWSEISDRNGSIQGMKEFTEHEQKVYKTAFEIDQHWIIQHAIDRQQYICQGQSTNLFFPSGADADYVNSVHLMAAASRKIKTLYYYRTNAQAKASTAKSGLDWADPDRCISCEA